MSASRGACRGAVLLLAVLAAALIWPQRAHAIERIERYDVELFAPEHGAVARYRLRFDYRASPAKTSGFKFFGWEQPLNVRVTDGAGKKMAFTQPSRYDQARIDWAVPQPEEDGRQTVVVEFEQPLVMRYGWREQSASVPWAHESKIPVAHMRVTSHAPGASHAKGCRYDGKQSHCVKERNGAFPVAGIALGSRAVGPGFTVLMALLALSLGALAWRYRVVRRNLVQERGVMAPAPAEFAFAGGYRAPPELPQASVQEPQLSHEDARMLWRRLALILLTLTPTALMAVALDGISRLPMPSVVGMGLLVWTACALLLVTRPVNWQTVALPLALQIAVAALALMGTNLSEFKYRINNVVPFVLMAGLIGGISLARHKGWIKGTSGSNGSSCSSCSSCGGGGCGGGCGGCGG